MKVPKNEKTVVSYYTEDMKHHYVITQSLLKDKFTLYKVLEDDNYEKMATADSPLKLEEIIKKDKERK